MLQIKNFLLLCILVTIAACGGDDTVMPDPEENVCDNGTMTVTIGGDDYAVATITATIVKDDLASVPAKGLLISADHADGRKLQLGFTSISEGADGDNIPVQTYYEDATLSLCQTSGGFDVCEGIDLNYFISSTEFETNDSFGPGSAEITSCDPNLGLVSGTFNLVIDVFGSDDEIPVVGSFTNICYLQ